MRRVLKWVTVGVSAAIGIPAWLLVVLLLVANTDPGQRVIETLTARLTLGSVHLEGFGGRFPNAIRLRQITVADNAGVWLTVGDAALDWSPLRLIEGQVAIERLEARRVAVARLPEASGGSTADSLPVLPVDLSRLTIARLEIGPAVAGQPITLTVAGSARVADARDGVAHLSITVPEATGAPSSDGIDRSKDLYLVDATLDSTRLHATLTVAEAPHGLIAGLAGLPDLGWLAITASADGPLNALATRASIEAGPLRGRLDGTADIDAQRCDVTVSITAPAMSPGPGVAWSSVRLEGRVHGPFAAPEARGTLSADAVTAAGATIGSVRADLSGNAAGETELHARLDGLRVPGPSPDILASGPLTLDATARLRDVNWPVRFALRHPAISAEGTADVTQGRARLTIPELAPFAALGGLDLRGSSTLDITARRAGDSIDLTAAGGLGVSSGPQPIPALIGDAGTVDVAATVTGQDVRLTRMTLTGRGVQAAASGQFVDRRADLDLNVTVNQLGDFRAGTSGTVEARVHVSGPETSLTVVGDVTGNAVAEFGRLDRFKSHLELTGLPDAPSGRLTAGGSVLNAPVDVAVSGERRDGGFHVVIDRAAWKSLTAGGTLDMAPGDSLPTGRISLKMTRLADLAPPLGQPIAGELTASLESSREAAHVTATVNRGSLARAGSVVRAGLVATITDPAGQPAVDGTLTMDDLSAGGVRASGRVVAKGPLDRLALTLTAGTLTAGTLAAGTGDPRGAPARIETAATLDATAHTLVVESLRGAWNKETIRLLAPARIAFAPDLAVDKLRLGFRQGELTVDGRWRSGSAGLDMRAALSNLPADIIADFAPAYAADGSISGEAHLTGNPAHPSGSIRIAATQLRMRTGTGRALPVAASTMAAKLDGANALVDGSLTAGASRVTLSGRVPLDLARSMDLRIGGALDLAMLNPVLNAQGRSVKGQLDLALGLNGTAAAPKANGSVRVTNGDFQDAVLGSHLSAITAEVQAEGDTIRIARFTGTAGPGTITVGGTVLLGAAPAVDLSLRASNARILSTDLANAIIDANLTARGQISGTTTLAGTVLVRTAEIRVPEKLPPSIAVIPVRDSKAPPPKPPPASATTPDVALNLTLDAPNQIYIRGRGLDAELGGRVTFAGTVSRPLPQGALHLRRGAFSLAGESLALTEGTIDFAGGPLTNPPLKLVATSGTAAFLATLTVSGEVRDPKITLSSVPDMPQDEILAQLLFRTGTGRLSAFQVAEIASGLATISGIGTPGGDPLGRVRAALGLDQLSVGTGANGGATLQAGRYVAPGVRLGASQGVNGDSQAKVEIDIAKGLKLQTMVGTGSSSAQATPTGESNGTGVGVTYQFEY